MSVLWRDVQGIHEKAIARRWVLRAWRAMQMSVVALENMADADLRRFARRCLREAASTRAERNRLLWQGMHCASMAALLSMAERVSIPAIGENCREAHRLAVASQKGAFYGDSASHKERLLQEADMGELRWAR